MKRIVLFLFVVVSFLGFSQSVGINSTGTPPDGSAILDVDVSGMANKKGILIPRMTSSERDSMVNSNAIGLLIFNMDCRVFQYWDGIDWIPFPSGAFNSSFPQNPLAVSNPEPVCQFNTLNLTGTAVNPFGSAANPLTWSWTGPAGYTSTQQNPVIANVQTSATGSYLLAVSNQCGSTSALPITVTVDSIPPGPVNAPATNITDVSFTANWNASIGAVAYYLDVATDNGFSNIVSGYNDLNVGNVTTYNVTGLQNDQSYFYRVRAEGANVCGQSVSSDTVAVSTPVCFPQGWTAKADLGSGTINRQGAVGFSIGTKGYVGTGSNNNYLKDFWEWDQASDTWTQKADFGGAERQGAVAFVVGTDAFVGTGAHSKYLKDFWKYDSNANTWSQVADFGGAERQGAIAFSINGKGYVGTGSNDKFFNDFWEYDPSSDTWTQKTNFAGDARQGAMAFSLATTNFGYVSTGVNDGYYADFWQYDPTGDAWTQLNDFGGGERQGGVAIVIDTIAYMGIGSHNGYLADWWQYDHTTDTWSQRPDLTGAARQGAVGFAIGPYGYVGTGNNNRFLHDLWEYCQAGGN